MPNDKGRWGKVIKDARTLASKKGLSVTRNQFKPGWAICLPNGSTHNATTDSEMVRFVRGY